MPLQVGTGLDTVKLAAQNESTELSQQLSRDSSEKQIVLGHIILVIWHSSRLLQQCFEDRSYKAFGNYK